MSNMEKHLFNLKFAAKERSRSAKKCDKEEKPEKAKIKKAIQKVNFLRMSARVHAVAARVHTTGIHHVGQASKVLGLQISALMDKFEHQFEILDVQTQQMEDTMSSTTTLTTPQNQVDVLLQEMAYEAGLNFSMELRQGQTGSVGTSVALAEQDELSQRLAYVRDQV
uniref:Uncharacterized protein n=1 Tax=Cebus imitator TaxID=2715852 RepID=A0A2K5QR81_CEBIM